MLSLILSQLTAAQDTYQVLDKHQEMLENFTCVNKSDRHTNSMR